MWPLWQPIRVVTWSGWPTCLSPPSKLLETLSATKLLKNWRICLENCHLKKWLHSVRCSHSLGTQSQLLEISPSMLFSLDGEIKCFLSFSPVFLLALFCVRASTVLMPFFPSPSNNLWAWRSGWLCLSTASSQKITCCPVPGGTGYFRWSNEVARSIGRISVGGL